jgi:hypothetical protein
MGRSPALRSWKPDYGNRREEEKKDIGEGRRSIFVLEAPVFGKRPTGRDACLALRIHIACQECASRRMEVNYEIPYYSPFCCGYNPLRYAMLNYITLRSATRRHALSQRHGIAYNQA